MGWYRQEKIHWFCFHGAKISSPMLTVLLWTELEFISPIQKLTMNYEVEAWDQNQIKDMMNYNQKVVSPSRVLLRFRECSSNIGMLNYLDYNFLAETQKCRIPKGPQGCSPGTQLAIFSAPGRWKVFLPSFSQALGQQKQLNIYGASFGHVHWY